MSVVSGYHSCPCRDCFEVAIGGLITLDDDGDEDLDTDGEEVAR